MEDSGYGQSNALDLTDPLYDSLTPPRKRARPPDKEFQRTYKACISCRRRKARCDLGPSGAGPCARCRREQRDCVFSAERKRSSSSKVQNDTDEAQNTPTSTGQSHGTVNGQANGQVAHRSTPSSASRNPKHSHTRSLADSVIRSGVSKGNDGLSILFEAAAHQEDLSHGSPLSDTPNDGDRLSRPSRETCAVWERTRYVMAGWLSAEEAVTLVDLFFQNLCPFTPALSNHYQQHAHHYQLVSSEPLLASTILMISSRHHLLPSVGSASRGYYMHEQFWQSCQHLIQRLLYGQEKSSISQTRSLGSIEALLLIVDWHPRAIHFPPGSELGWDSRIYVPDGGRRVDARPDSSTSTKWLEDVIEPARRSDRMSWMLLGTALTLAHELGVFDQETDESGKQGANSFESRKWRVRKLLYVYINQLASRLGCSSMVTQNIPAPGVADPSDEWHSQMSAWIELTRLVKSASEHFFSTPATTRQLLNSGNYSALLDELVPELEQWRLQHLNDYSYGELPQDTIFMEYQYARIYINSLGMEAVCQRALSEMEADPEHTFQPSANFEEHGYINEVIDGGINILERVIGLADSDRLRYSPIRTFLRTTTTCVFLLKAISLGVRNAKLQAALETLDRTISAMRKSHLDDVHLASRFATLLQIHVDRLRQGFIISSQKQTRPSRGASRGTTRRGSPDGPYQNGDVVEPEVPLVGPPFLPLEDLSADEWLSLPFDPNMAPFGPDGFAGFPAFDENGLDFIWNLPMG